LISCQFLFCAAGYAQCVICNLEAMVCGTPVVATAVGGIPEQVEDGITGFLVPPGNVEVMVERIIRLLGNEELRLRMSHQATEDARQRFDLNRQVGQLPRNKFRGLQSGSRG